MRLTINNIDLNRPNTLNLTSVENEYDKAMSYEAAQEKADPVGYNSRELAHVIRSANRWNIAKEVGFSLGWMREEFTPEQFAAILASVSPELRAKCDNYMVELV